MPYRACRAVCLTMLLSLLWGCGISNIPTFDEAVNNAWHEVHDQYSLRADLVNELLDALPQSKWREENLLQQLREAEDSVIQMNVSPETLTNADEFEQFRNNQNALSSALASVLTALTDAEWFANDDVLQALREQLEKNENRITVARRDYIQKVDRYNTELETIPGRWWRAFMYSDTRKKESFPNSTEESPFPRVHNNS